jgi:hypothetical protein
VLIQAQMVPMPVTAGEKFREAVYFFERMNETRTNVHLFPFHFSAFLSALRSVTFYLQSAESLVSRLGMTRNSRRCVAIHFCEC